MRESLTDKYETEDEEEDGMRRQVFMKNERERHLRTFEDLLLLSF
jgi:hypothetical protein